MSRRITAGNDAPFRWVVKLQGQPFDLSGKDVKVYVINSRGEIPVARLSIEGHEVSGVFEGRYQTRLGEHSLVLRVNEGRPEMKTAAVANVFELVQWSAEAGGSDEGDVIVAPVLIESELSIGGGSSYDDTEIKNELARLEREKADKSELTELSAEVGKLPTKEYVDNAVANAGGGGGTGSSDDTMTRVLAGATPFICYRKTDGTIGFWEGYFVGMNHRLQEDIVEILFGGLGPKPDATQFLNSWKNLERIYPLMNGSGSTKLSFAFMDDAKLKDLSMLKDWDVSQVTDANSCFAGCAPEILPIDNWNIAKMANMSSMFKDYKGIDVDFSRWTNNVVTTLVGFMRGSSVKKADLHNINTENCTSFEGAMRSCNQLQWLDIRGWSCVSATSLHAMLNGCSVLTTLVGDTSIEDIISEDIKVLDGYTATSNLSIKESSIPLNRASLRALINGLADMSETGATLPIGSANIAKLTSEDIAVATAKGWTIS